jgi:hypothetical protein
MNGEPSGHRVASIERISGCRVESTSLLDRDGSYYVESPHAVSRHDLGIVWSDTAVYSRLRLPVSAPGVTFAHA